MTPEIAAVLAAACALVGVIGIVIPVLPGSLTIGVGFLLWAWFAHSTFVWVAFGLGAALLVIGAVSSALITRRSLARRKIPQWPIFVGIVGAIVGNFVLPALGMPIGFVVFLLVAEWIRVRNFRAAVNTSIVAVKSLGVGMLVELGCALLASALMAVSMAVVFWF